MEITDLTPAERRVWDAFPRGERVDFRADPDEDVSGGAAWGPERTLRAEVLAALLLRGDHADTAAAAAEGRVAGLNIEGARIAGRLDLKYAVVEHAVRLRGCWFERKPLLYGAQLRALVLSHSVLPGLTAATLRVDITLRLTGCRITGPVRLQGARTGGGLFLQRAVIGDPGAQEEAEEPALQINHADIGTDVIAMDLTVHGQTRVNGATIGGQINLDGARLYAPGGTALHAETLTVGTDLRGRAMEAVGRVNLSSARIPGHLNLARARLVNPDGVALRASSCVIGELWLRACDTIQGDVNLRRSQLDMLYISPETWPEQIRIDGLTYRTLAPHLPAEQRLPALEREESGYLPYAYEQLAAAYRTAGDEGAARTVQLAKLRRHRRTLPRHARLWGLLQDATVGYGFRPLRAAGWLLALLTTGAIAYGLHPPRALKAGEAPDFNAVFYTLDLMVPIIGFGQEAAFAPGGWYQWLSYLLIVTGWVLATTTAAGVSRSLQRQ
ncbi:MULTISPECIES: membrane-associated oxidoreductase [unclassified Streptomyces]|uniref:membrane-associated oxidoreductase n=1 Tax=unclassified Streptomyces TaxID=2593676 RepID=UPI00224DA2FD|nr:MULTISPECIES: membrane-associated oxidoreductase [unclassified Streptomyces]MCX4524907.1 membrane-associated oxidoreductase [Streptomyces sp. NBC_01551]MCX4544581.1 membrane-associated oxidoreductase [Streptomyces sp. NBC_01565]